jgi:hypothetical protein
MTLRDVAPHPISLPQRRGGSLQLATEVRGTFHGYHGKRDANYSQTYSLIEYHPVIDYKKILYEKNS